MVCGYVRSGTGAHTVFLAAQEAQHSRGLAGPVAAAPSTAAAALLLVKSAGGEEDMKLFSCMELLLGLRWHVASTAVELQGPSA